MYMVFDLHLLLSAVAPLVVVPVVPVHHLILQRAPWYHTNGAPVAPQLKRVDGFRGFGHHLI